MVDPVPMVDPIPDPIILACLTPTLIPFIQFPVDFVQ